jgi:hypothetical protein
LLELLLFFMPVSFCTSSALPSGAYRIPRETGLLHSISE